MCFQIHVSKHRACLGKQIMVVYEVAVSVPKCIIDAQKCHEKMDRIK